MSLWNTKQSGLTHFGLLKGVIPRYITMRGGEVEWMAVSDLLYPVEDVFLRFGLASAG